jgi:amino acid transporter
MTAVGYVLPFLFCVTALLVVRKVPSSIKGLPYTERRRAWSGLALAGFLVGAAFYISLVLTG